MNTDEKLTQLIDALHGRFVKTDDERVRYLTWLVRCAYEEGYRSTGDD